MCSAIVNNFDNESYKDKANIGKFLYDSRHSKKRIVCNGLEWARSPIGVTVPNKPPKLNVMTAPDIFLLN